MLNLINSIVARAKADRQRIVLPEGTEERTLKAANQILTDEVADLILLGNPDEIHEAATKWGLGNIGKGLPLLTRRIIRNKKSMHSYCASFAKRKA